MQSQYAVQLHLRDKDKQNSLFKHSGGVWGGVGIIYWHKTQEVSY